MANLERHASWISSAGAMLWRRGSAIAILCLGFILLCPAVQADESPLPDASDSNRNTAEAGTSPTEAEGGRTSPAEASESAPEEGDESTTDDSDSEEEEEDEPYSAIREEFLSNPLEAEELDPLIPRLAVERPFSPQELSVLRAALDELNAQGEAQYQAGNLPEALEIWTRELRLRRLLGPQEEAESLGRVGAIAWGENRTTEVRLITERLQQIWAAELGSADPSGPPTPIDFDLLLTVGDAFRQVRAYDDAVMAYRQIAIEARRRDNLALQEDALNTLAQLHLGWFRYPEAAAVYQELLAFAQNQGDRDGEITYLQSLTRVYDQGNLPQQAIAVQEQLVDVYRQQNTFAEIPAVKLAIANNYLKLGQAEPAAASYQEAYSIAQSQRQFGYASDALRALAALYESLSRPNDALIVYQLLIDVERQSYNSYGQMEAYDKIGQIYREQGNTSLAIAAFQQGLALAQQLSYRQDYFAQQIQQLSQGQ